MRLYLILVFQTRLQINMSIKLNVCRSKWNGFNYRYKWHPFMFLLFFVIETKSTLWPLFISNFSRPLTLKNLQIICFDWKNYFLRFSLCQLNFQGYPAKMQEKFSFDIHEYLFCKSLYPRLCVAIRTNDFKIRQFVMFLVLKRRLIIALRNKIKETYARKRRD